jgi:spore maturation protein CgeB
MLHRRTPDLKELFEEDVDCAAFDDASEAVEQIKRYLGEERARSAIAENGRRRVESAHSWDHRVKTVLDRYSLMILERVR